MKRFFLMAAILIVVLVAVANRPGATTITVDANQSFQTMTGWEMTSDLVPDPTVPHWARINDKVMDLASDIGINRVRLEISPASEHPDRIVGAYIAGKLSGRFMGVRYEPQNDNDDPFTVNPAAFDFSDIDWHMQQSVLPLKQRLEAKGERLWINLCYVSFRESRTFQVEPEEYAELILAAWQHMQSTYGLVPDSLEVILEPDNSNGSWRGRDIGLAMVATARRLEAAGFKRPSFVAPSVTDLRATVPYLNEMLGVPRVKGLLGEVSYHRYGGTLTPQLAKRAAEAGAKTSMLELWFGRATYHVLFEDLTLGQVSAWQGRVIHDFYTVSEGADPTLTLQDDVRYNAQVFRAARMGAVRIGATSSQPGQVDAVAFRNPDGRQSVVIKATRPRSITVEGLAAGTYELSFAVKSGSGSEPDVTVTAGEPVQVTIPGTGLFSIIGK